MKTHEDAPAAWLVPTLIDFSGAAKVHFSRAEGCTASDDALKEQLDGTVQWRAEIFSDGDGVTDKHGVRHYPVPMYRALTPNA